jgi:hypothetical protein
MLYYKSNQSDAFMATREWRKCDCCGSDVYRVVYNYRKQRPVNNFFCNTKCKGVWQKQQRENLGFTKEWLTYEYIILGKGANEIAKDIGRDPKRVWEWIRDYGIPTRKRGSDPNQHFKKGQESAFKGKHHTESAKKKLSLAQSKNSAWRGKFGKEHPRYGLKPKCYKGGISPERQSVYGSREWKDAVKAVWKRDNATCQNCGKHKSNHRDIDFDIHHIVSFANKELRCEPSNLVLLCEPCHYWVHSSKNTEKKFIKEIN